MEIPLIIYRISGWLINIATILLAYYAIRNRSLWKSPYVFLAIYFCFVAFAEIVSSITALTLSNNLFLEYFIVPTLLALKSLYLISQLNKTWAKNIVYIVIGVLIGFQIIEIVLKKDLLENFSYGSYINSNVIFLLSIWCLSLLFKSKASLKLRLNPNFWFTSAILSFAFLDIFISILAETSYAAESDLALYILFISENFIKIFLYYIYYKGVKLVSKGFNKSFF